MTLPLRPEGAAATRLPTERLPGFVFAACVFGLAARPLAAAGPARPSAFLFPPFAAGRSRAPAAGVGPEALTLPSPVPRERVFVRARDAGAVRSARVTAPSAAEETSATYFANTPAVYGKPPGRFSARRKASVSPQSRNLGTAIFGIFCRERLVV